MPTPSSALLPALPAESPRRPGALPVFPPRHRRSSVLPEKPRFLQARPDISLQTAPLSHAAAFLREPLGAPQRPRPAPLARNGLRGLNARKEIKLFPHNCKK